jgi:hypothetical protein
VYYTVYLFNKGCNEHNTCTFYVLCFYYIALRALPNNSYKPITNTAWVRARLCKLQLEAPRSLYSSPGYYKMNCELMLTYGKQEVGI